MTLLDKAKAIAKLDKELNMGYVNAPYTILDDDGMIFKARIITERQSDKSVEVRLVVEKPVTHVGSCKL